MVFSGTSAELFCHIVSLMMLRSDSLTSLKLFSNKLLCTMISFDSSSSVTLEFDDEAVFFRITAVIVPIEFIRSHHTLRKLLY